MTTVISPSNETVNKHFQDPKITSYEKYSNLRINKMIQQSKTITKAKLS